MTVRGTQDFFGTKERLFSKIENLSKELFTSFGYTRLRFPIIESTDLFVRSISSSDIVNKELYSFKDRGDREISLIPEGTAPSVRAILDNSLYPTKVFYISPFFRYDRPQKGRYRQFHQIGAEIVGYKEEFADAEALIILTKILNNLNIDFQISTNFIGSNETRAKYKEYLSNQTSKYNLCDDCIRRSQQNILRILDCKVCKFEFRNIDEFLSVEEQTSYNKILDILSSNNIKVSKKNIIRGLDYYTGFVFEVEKELALAGGGRYNNLYKEIGNKDVPAVGFALGIERLIDLMQEQQDNLTDISILYTNQSVKLEAFNIANRLREKKISVDFPLDNMKFKNQIAKTNSRYVLIVGEREISDGKFTIKNMLTGIQEVVNLERVIEYVQK